MSHHAPRTMSTKRSHLVLIHKSEMLGQSFLSCHILPTVLGRYLLECSSLGHACCSARALALSYLLFPELDSTMSTQAGAGARFRASVDAQGPRAWSTTQYSLNGVGNVRPASEVVAPHGSQKTQVPLAGSHTNIESE